MKQILWMLIIIVTVFALAVMIQQVTLLVQLTDFFDQPPQYQMVTVVIVAVGIVLMISALSMRFIRRGRPMTDAEAQEFFRASAGTPRMVRVFRGSAVGRKLRNEVSFRDIKDAVRFGAWLRDTDRRLFFVTALGGLGFFFVIGRPFVKLLVGATTVYVIARTAWVVWKA